MKQELKNFGEAIEALKSGKRICRKNWNGKDMFIYLNEGSIDKSKVDNIGEPWRDNLIEGINPNYFISGDKDTVTRLPNINMKSVTGSTIIGWLASQTDILAEDWVILN